MAQKYSKIILNLGSDRVKTDLKLATRTTIGIGGKADLYYEAKNIKEITRAVTLARNLKVPFLILGGGSNILFSDEPFRGIVIKVANNRLKVNLESILVDAGLALASLVEQCAKEGLSGIEFLAGIPGTVGGAVVGNAGAWGQAIGDKVKRVKVLNAEGKVEWVAANKCDFSYRQSVFKMNQSIVLSVELSLVKRAPAKVRQKVNQNLKKRQDLPQERSAGCIFVNPKPLVAGKLIEECDLKGQRIGDAQISPKHANFIINLGQAKSSDVEKLIGLAKEKVKKKFGVSLVEEVKRV